MPVVEHSFEVTDQFVRSDWTFVKSEFSFECDWWKLCANVIRVSCCQNKSVSLQYFRKNKSVSRIEIPENMSRQVRRPAEYFQELFRTPQIVVSEQAEVKTLITPEFGHCIKAIDSWHQWNSFEVHFYHFSLYFFHFSGSSDQWRSNEWEKWRRRRPRVTATIAMQANTKMSKCSRYKCRRWY